MYYYLPEMVIRSSDVMTFPSLIQDTLGSTSSNSENAQPYLSYTLYSQTQLSYSVHATYSKVLPYASAYPSDHCQDQDMMKSCHKHFGNTFPHHYISLL